jgi:hypothetical protein
MHRAGLLCVLFGASCAAAPPPVDVVRAAYNDSFCSHYKVTLDQGRDILRAVCRWLDARQEWEFVDENFTYADLGGGLAAGAWMRAHEDGVILSVTLRAAGAERLTREEIHAWFAKGVALVRSGRPLPLEPPVSNP